MLIAVVAAQNCWRDMTKVQRERLADFDIMRTHPATERVLKEHGLIEGAAWEGASITGWGRWVLHVAYPERFPRPERIEIEAKFWPLKERAS